MAARKGRMEEMTNHAAGWVRMDFIVPAVADRGSAPTS